MKRIDGVESIEVSIEKASADIRLRPDNRVTLEQIRRAIRSNGYPTKVAEITARGTFAEQDGKPVFDLRNGSVLTLTEKPPSPPSGVVEITGVSTFDEKSGERLTVATVK